MVAVTAPQRTRLYFGLALVFFLVLVFTVTASALPMWTVDHPNQYGIWSVCVKSDNGWTVRTCNEIAKTSQCNGWTQASRFFSLVGIWCWAFLIFVCIGCALQAIITKLLPFVGVLFGFVGVVSHMMLWISHLAIRDTDCMSLDGHPLGASFVIHVAAWGVSFLAFIVLVYLFIANILVPTDPDVADKSYPVDMPAVYTVPMEE